MLLAEEQLVCKVVCVQKNPCCNSVAHNISKTMKCFISVLMAEHKRPLDLCIGWTHCILWLRL